MVKELRLKHLIWLLPLIYILHNLEEGLTMQIWLGDHPMLINLLLRKQITIWFWHNFTSVREVALIIASALPFILYFFVKNFSERKFAIYIVTITAWVIVINSTQHAAMTVFLRIYTPGVVSAVFINLPFAFFLLNFIQKEQEFILPKKPKWILISILIYPFLMTIIWLIAVFCIRLFI